MVLNQGKVEGGGGQTQHPALQQQSLHHSLPPCFGLVGQGLSPSGDGGTGDRRDLER